MAKSKCSPELKGLQVDGGKKIQNICVALGASQCDFSKKLAENLAKNQEEDIKNATISNEPYYESVYRYMYSLPLKYLLGQYGELKSAILKTVDYFCEKEPTADQVKKRWEKKGTKLLDALDKINDKAVELNSRDI